MIKRWLYLLCFMLLVQTICSQTNSREEQVAILERAVNTEADSLRRVLMQKDDYLSDMQKKLAIEFTIDTFKIESLLSKQMDIDYTTLGMVDAAANAQKQYDKLLNKYYQMLLNQLNDSDKSILVQVEKDWIQYKNDEQTLNVLMSDDQYSGGGTIQQIFIVARNLEITKQRVIDIYGYISRINSE